jgi:DNA-binding response OmpR family regulator
MPQILIIEDDKDIATVVRHALERDGFRHVNVTADGESGLKEATDNDYDLVLLDLNLPGMDGLQVCRALRQREQSKSIAIIMMTARVDESSRVAGLELGADDYISKPFSTKELCARVRAILRRTQNDKSIQESLSCGALTIDSSSRRTRIDGEEIPLTRKEFDLLFELMSRKGRVLSRERLLEFVWGYEHPGSTRTVDVHVRQLRKKLGPPLAARLETVVGVGYRFRTEGT